MNSMSLKKNVFVPLFLHLSGCKYFSLVYFKCIHFSLHHILCSENSQISVECEISTLTPLIHCMYIQSDQLFVVY